MEQNKTIQTFKLMSFLIVQINTKYGSGGYSNWPIPSIYS